MYPALKNLKASGKYIIAALSNTVNFPPGHALHRPDFFSDPMRSLFDVFVSSAHVGMRKPDRKMYQYTLNELDKFARSNANSPRGQSLRWGEGIRPEDVVFLDDIGENLKAAKALGIQTLKVTLGKSFEAVDQLEAVTGLRLAGDHPRIPIQPKVKNSKAKI